MSPVGFDLREVTSTRARIARREPRHGCRARCEDRGAGTHPLANAHDVTSDGASDAGTGGVRLSTKGTSTVSTSPCALSSTYHVIRPVLPLKAIHAVSSRMTPRTNHRGASSNTRSRTSLLRMARVLLKPLTCARVVVSRHQLLGSAHSSVRHAPSHVSLRRPVRRTSPSTRCTDLNQTNNARGQCN